ncbi:hypothetical protein CRI93_03630 [Longimonas halophila]|uniref:6-bladed beta-propeller n=1 Tax=Longimonas halophila TaxID=1469170 RepID=A0A2H3P9Y1_9BACT|nr:6-bladed beta-propeller [Longimonas halophila]PEN08851.1 hypothetical protein CRI93_03630 [Longimonas halophila]
MRFLQVILATVLFLVTLSACSSDTSPEVHTLSESDQLVPLDTIAIQETDEDYIGNYDVLYIANAPFRMYVPDIQRGRIAVLNRNGTIARYIGEPGAGPGELSGPVSVKVAGDRVVVKQSNGQRIAVFDTSGTYVDSYQFPEGVQSLGAHAFYIVEEGYIHAATRSESVLNLPASPEQPTLAYFNEQFELEHYFGSYPEMYTEAEYALGEASIDVQDGKLVVGYNLTPDVQVYNTENRALADVKQLSHPEFKHPSESLSIDMAQSDRSGFLDRLSNVSLVRRTYVTPNQTLVQGFENRSLAYYENEHDPAEREDYAILADLNSDQQETLRLPGPILARDDVNRIYVELDPTPDQRKIGVYEVVGWDD